MRIKENIGKVDSFIRLMVGFSMLACAIAKLSRKPSSMLGMLWAMMASCEIATGITRFCPVMYLVKEYEDEIEDVMDRINF